MVAMSVAALVGCVLAAGDAYDLVIAGGTLEGVRLAVREAAAGRKVYLVAPRPYLADPRRVYANFARKVLAARP